MKANDARTDGAVADLTVPAVPGGPSTAVAEETVCEGTLPVELSQGMPRASDDGVLRSLACSL